MLMPTSYLDAGGPVRFRLVILGHSGTGKTAILRRFFFDKFEESRQRTETEETIHSKLFEVNGILIQADVVDTIGSELIISAPASRRFTIMYAQVFILVYSI